MIYWNYNIIWQILLYILKVIIPLKKQLFNYLSSLKFTYIQDVPKFATKHYSKKVLEKLSTKIICEFLYDYFWGNEYLND